MWKDIKRVEYWEFPRPRKSPSDNWGGFCIAEREEDIPSVVRSSAVKRHINVPLRIWAEKSFRLVDFINMVAKRASRPS